MFNQTWASWERLRIPGAVHADAAAAQASEGHPTGGSDDRILGSANSIARKLDTPEELLIEMWSTLEVAIFSEKHIGNRWKRHLQCQLETQSFLHHVAEDGLLNSQGVILSSLPEVRNTKYNMSRQRDQRDMGHVGHDQPLVLAIPVVMVVP